MFSRIAKMQEADSLNAYHLYRHWDLEVHPATLSALQCLTGDQFDWKPEGWHSSARDLAAHMCRWEWAWIYRNALQFEPWESRWSSKEFASWTDLIAYWEHVHSVSTQWLMNTPLTDLDRIYALPYDDRPSATLQWIVDHVIEHETHHRGQVFMLLRMQGVNPPEI